MLIRLPIYAIVCLLLNQLRKDVCSYAKEKVARS